MLSLSEADKARGVIACSAGNHGIAVAYASQVCGVQSTIIVPTTIDRQRQRDLERFDIELRLVGANYAEAESAAIAEVEQQGATFISPYNDSSIIAGQGTIGLELIQQLPEIDIVVVAVGGGGLVAGVGAYLKSLKPQIVVIGVSPVNSAMMFDAVSDTPAEFSADLPTLSDSTAGPIQEGSMTISLCKAVVDQWVLVEEEDIRAAMRYLFYEHRLVVEGAGALAVAACMKEQQRFKDANAALVVCGGNIDPKKFLGLVGNPRR
jgi:threonine dehydratase